MGKITIKKLKTAGMEELKQVSKDLSLKVSSHHKLAGGHQF